MSEEKKPLLIQFEFDINTIRTAAFIVGKGKKLMTNEELQEKYFSGKPLKIDPDKAFNGMNDKLLCMALLACVRDSELEEKPKSKFQQRLDEMAEKRGIKTDKQ